MRILFNLINCGLGNNGGSQTIIKTANTLSKLGNKVYLIDSGKCKYTWDEILVPHINTNDGNEIPEADVIIATGFKTIKSTLELPKKCGTKYHWIRGWETWQMSEEKIISDVLNVPTIKIVNGNRIHNKLKSLGISSYIIRPGIDDDLYFDDEKIKRNKYYFTIGGLYNVRHKFKNVEYLLEVISCLKHTSYAPIKLFMYGTPKDPNNKFIDYYISNPSHKDKNWLYNNCDLWIAPTTNDSLHIPPMEAMLSSCPVLGLSHESSGMTDYLIDNYNGYTVNNLNEFIEKIIDIIRNRKHLEQLRLNCRNSILEKIGNRTNNIKKLVNILNTNLG